MQKVKDTTVRVTGHTHAVLSTLAAKSGRSISSIVKDAVEEYRRKCFWEEANAGFQALRDNPEDWEHELQERKLWEQTLADGLEDE